MLTKRFIGLDNVLSEITTRIQGEKPNYGDLLRVAMAAANLSPSQLSRQVHVQPNTIRQYAQGRSIPDIKIASEIAKATGQSLDYFQL